GIGHFIWYVKGNEGPFDESWPKLLAYFQANGVPYPRWLKRTPDCPWPDRETFEADRESERMVELRNFLQTTIDEQTRFIIARLEAALPKMLQHGARNREEQAQLQRNFAAVGTTGQGVYALIDYVNFKGEGTKPEERYQGVGWGLAQVLLEMNGNPQGAQASVEFSEAAKRVLTRRVELAPREESQWLKGWINRCETYKNPL
ncbi:MAG: hypothetical protein AAGJ31_10875, partial [Verrucomicrobiota bacterium]